MTGAVSFSPLQKENWAGTIDEFHRWNISEGATRSGKTFLDFYRIPTRIRRAPLGTIILLGNTQATLERNILEPMRGIWGEGIVSRIGDNNRLKIAGRSCYALGADKITQVAKIQGTGLAYAYGDEVGTWCEEVFQMLKSRLDKKGSCFDGTCNPESHNHWLLKFLESDADIKRTRWKIDDNPFLEPDFVANLKKEYAGTIYYDRYILGLWKAAEGIIYTAFANEPERFIIDRIDPAEIAFSTVGVDFGGGKSAHAFQCTTFLKGFKSVVTTREYREKKALSPTELEGAFCKFIHSCEGLRVCDVYCDNTEQTLINGLRSIAAKEKLSVEIHNAKKRRINDRIRFYVRLQVSGKYKVLRDCVNTIEAFSTAVWDKKFLTEDVRLDNGTTNIDTLDAQEYSTESYMNDILGIG